MSSTALPVLVVEDDISTRKLLVAILSRLDFKPVEAADGIGALALMEDTGIHIVISDWNMPNMDGPTLCTTLRERHPDRFIYILMLTAREGRDAHTAALDAGADDFVIKPVTAPELRARLQAARRMLKLHQDLAIRNQRLDMAHAFLSDQLASAQKVQIDLLPQPAMLGNAAFDWRLDPSCYIGGDTFDYFKVSEHLVAFYLIDVSGHGVAAAMLAYTAHTRLMYSPHQIAHIAEKHDQHLDATVREVVAGINRHFLDMKDTGRYMTMTFGLLDTRTNALSLTLSGHPPPLLLTTPDILPMPLGDGGLAIGMVDFSPDEVEVTSITLPQGGRMFIYSDGVTECETPSGEQYSEIRLAERIRSVSRVSLYDALDNIKSDLMAWRASELPEDDITLIGLEIHPLPQTFAKDSDC